MPSPEMPSPVLPGPEMPGPLARGDGGNDGLSSAEIGEIQALLSRLDLDPGSEQGSLTPATAAAIRSYQEMAGLPADGKADRALLDELRSVAELYGS
jgi:peptidoglycan hydrolase-like protein with peptidoglycan-binding domain